MGHEGQACFFEFYSGGQHAQTEERLEWVWAVRDGDVGCRPFPGGGATAGWFPGSGGFPIPEASTNALAHAGLALLGLVTSRQRRHPLLILAQHQAAVK